MTDLTGSYVYIRLTVDTSSENHALNVSYTSVAFMQDETSPMISIYPAEADIVLPKVLGRPFGFCIGYDGGSSSGYIWDSNVSNCVAIAAAPTIPQFGAELPSGFVGLKQNGGLMTFIDTNQVPDMQYEYSVRLIADPNGMYGGRPPLTLDPRIRNSTVN